MSSFDDDWKVLKERVLFDEGWFICNCLFARDKNAITTLFECVEKKDLTKFNALVDERYEVLEEMARTRKLQATLQATLRAEDHRKKVQILQEAGIACSADLTVLSVAQLKRLCESCSVPIYSRDCKADLRSKLNAFLPSV